MKYSQELLDKYRYINVDFGDWSDSVIENFKERVSEYGIDAGDIQFSGFCSQGDGACFSGYVIDIAKFMKAMGGSWDDYPNTLAVLKQLGEDIDISWKHNNSNYYHENTLSFYIEYDRLVDALSWNSPQLILDAADALDCAADAEYQVLEEDICSFIKGLCRELYRELRDEYEYLTSDEAVAEAIEACELDKEISNGDCANY